jgi:hypothetical protein
MFYTFEQNNSGGYYLGPEYLVVEANSTEEANRRFEDFDPDMSYCDCCGPRWSEAWSEKLLTEVPTVWGRPLENSGNQYVVFYLDTGESEGKELYRMLYKDMVIVISADTALKPVDTKGK